MMVECGGEVKGIRNKELEIWNLEVGWSGRWLEMKVQVLFVR